MTRPRASVPSPRPAVPRSNPQCLRLAPISSSRVRQRVASSLPRPSSQPGPWLRSSCQSANWKGLTQARQSWDRLTRLLSLIPPEPRAMALPAPTKILMVEAASVAAPGGEALVVVDASFYLQAGQGLCIIGPSASGKSSLARMLVGVWQPSRGKIRLDGASLEQWPQAQLGKHIGYLPQERRTLRRERGREHCSV